MADLLKKVGSSIIEPTVGNTSANNASAQSAGDLSFSDALKQALNSTNEEQETSEEAMTDLATGNVKDLHQAAIAISKAELSMKVMLEVRNKALSAYKQISQTQL